MKKHVLLLLFSWLVVQVYAQNKGDYGTYRSTIQEAYNQYKQKQYKAAAATYETAFKLHTPERTDLYNAACAFALDGQTDKAFKYLTKTVAKNYTNFKHLTTDPDFATIRADKRWLPLVNKVKENKLASEVKYGPVRKSLATVLEEDQKYRLMIDSVINKFGGQSAEFRNLVQQIHKTDSVNLQKVTGVIDKFGWLGPDEVGNEAAMAIFLVIQHADSATQVKYLPIMREAVKNGKALSQNLALLEDRVLLKQGKKQIYGSQVITDSLTQKPIFSPIEDELNVNKRRAAVGLEPLEDYAKRMRVEYKAPPANE